MRAIGEGVELGSSQAEQAELQNWAGTNTKNNSAYAPRPCGTWWDGWELRDFEYWSPAADCSHVADQAVLVEPYESERPASRDGTSEAVRGGWRQQVDDAQTRLSATRGMSRAMRSQTATW